MHFAMGIKVALTKVSRCHVSYGTGSHLVAHIASVADTMVGKPEVAAY